MPPAIAPRPSRPALSPRADHDHDDDERAMLEEFVAPVVVGRG